MFRKKKKAVSLVLFLKKPYSEPDIYFNFADDVCLLWKCIYILELAKLKSPTNAKIKLLLIRLYCTVGIFMPCAQIYDSLDVKHMQQDTLGFVYLKKYIKTFCG